MTPAPGLVAAAAAQAGRLVLLARHADRHRGHHPPPKVGASLDHGLHALGEFTRLALTVIVGGALLGWLVFLVLRRRGLKWTWTLLGVPAALLVLSVDRQGGLVLAGAVGLAAWEGARDHRRMLEAGGDLASLARRRTGIGTVVRRAGSRQRARREGWISRSGLLIGRDEHGHPARIPIGTVSGSHTLVVGAAGAGKTTTMAVKAARQIDGGFGCVAVDPKGDANLRDALKTAADRCQRVFVEWSPDGPALYNPYSHGTDTELVDKLLAGEEWTEPHYLRQAQRYLGHALRTLRLTGTPVELRSIVDACDPGRLEHLTRQLPDQDAEGVQRYLDALTAEQRRDLAGVRDRLAVLAESDLAPLLAHSDPNDARTQLDLHRVVERQHVAYFRLDADRRPLASQMIAAAILTDLITQAATRQHHPQPTVVLIDEFAALDTRLIARLFGRGRSAGLSLLLGTQELADLAHTDTTLRDQVAGNIETLIAHRQNVPESAEFIAGMAGTQGTWITTTQTGPLTRGQHPDTGTRTRGYEYVIHPDHLKRLPTGKAVIVTPSRGPARTIRIDHPDQGRP